jgi:hypothetical protein
VGNNKQEINKIINLGGLIISALAIFDCKGMKVENAL